jgi:hypothetical protein
MALIMVECCYAECRKYILLSAIMLNVVKMSVIMIIVIMSVIMLNVVAPQNKLGCYNMYPPRSNHIQLNLYSY